MNFVTISILFMSIIVIYLLLIGFFTTIFRITGLSRAKAFFQTISLLTAVGFTTSESELITENPSRRRIAIACMIIGNLLSIVVISLMIDTLSTFDMATVQSNGWLLALAFGIFVSIVILMELPFIRKPVEKAFYQLGRKMYRRRHASNIVTILDNYGTDSIASIVLNTVPNILKDKTLQEAHIRNQYDVSIMAIKRRGKTVELNKNTVLQDGDDLIVYGNKQNIKELFTHTVTDEEYERKCLEHNLRNDIFIVDFFGETAMAEIKINVMPPVFADKTLFESNVKTDFGINVMIIKRGGESIEIGKNTRVEKGDVIIVFGNYNNIHHIFDVTKQDV